MKKLTLLVLLISCISYAQNKMTFSIGGDIKNCISGSNATNNEPKPDILVKLTIQNQRMMEIGIGAEVFTAIDFNKVFVTVGRRIDLTNKLKLIGSIEPTVIDRTSNWGGGISKEDPKMFFTGGGSATFRYIIIPEIALEVQSNLLYRRDLQYQYNSDPWVVSNYFSVVFKL